MGRPPSCNCFCGPQSPPPPPLDCDCPELGTWEQFQDVGKERILVIQICNTNSSRDDNMRIFLNDTELGVVNHDSNARTGIIFVSDSSVTIDDSDSLLVCQGQGHPQVSFNPNILNQFPINNIITAETVKPNFNGNYGELVVASYPTPYTSGGGCTLFRRVWSDAERWDYQFSLCEGIISDIEDV